MDQNLSDVLDDKDEFYKDHQTLFYWTRNDALLGFKILKDRGYNNVVLRQEDETWIVEGER